MIKLTALRAWLRRMFRRRPQPMAIDLSTKPLPRPQVYCDPDIDKLDLVQRLRNVGGL